MSWLLLKARVYRFSSRRVFSTDSPILLGYWRAKTRSIGNHIVNPCMDVVMRDVQEPPDGRYFLWVDRAYLDVQLCQPEGSVVDRHCAELSSGEIATALGRVGVVSPGCTMAHRNFDFKWLWEFCQFCPVSAFLAFNGTLRFSKRLVHVLPVLPVFASVWMWRGSRGHGQELEYHFAVEVECHNVSWLYCILLANQYLCILMHAYAC